MEKHYHYRVQGYDKEDKKKSIMWGVVELTTIAENEKEALSLVKPMCKKKYYRIKDVWQCLEEHGMQANIQVLQLEMQKKMYDLMKPSSKVDCYKGKG